MLVQLHWQNMSDFRETKLVAQDEIRQGAATAADVLKRFEAIIEARRGECPEGWGPMVCTEDYEGFVLAAPKEPAK